MRDQIGSVLIVAPVTLVYALPFIKYVVANTKNDGKKDHIDPLPAAAMYVVIFAFCASLMLVVVKFVFMSTYQVNEFKCG